MSIKESKVFKMIEENPEDLVKITQKQIIKSYPQATRTTSTNYKPYPIWNSGLQVGKYKLKIS